MYVILKSVKKIQTIKGLFKSVFKTLKECIMFVVSELFSIIKIRQTFFLKKKVLIKTNIKPNFQKLLRINR